MPKTSDKIKILIVSANPETTRPLRLDKEKRDIEDALRSSPQRDSFAIEILNAARITDLRRIFVDPQRTPNVLHFCGHGSGGKGLVFEDRNGEAKYIQGDDLAEFLSLFTESLECVVLNACYSKVQANQIQKHVNCVIGMEEAIGDKSAIAFAVAFYEALFAGRSFQFAYDYANKAIKLDGDFLSDLRPILLLRETVITQPFSFLKKEVINDATQASKIAGNARNISMVQNGNNSVQLGNVSGGTVTVNYAGNQNDIGKKADESKELRENLKYGYALGFKLGRLEFLWDSIFDEAKKEFSFAKREIDYMLSSDSIAIEAENFVQYSQSIFAKYVKNSLVTGAIYLGVFSIRFLIAQGANSSYSDELKELAVDALTRSSLIDNPRSVVEYFQSGDNTFESMYTYFKNIVAN